MRCTYGTAAALAAGLLIAAAFWPSTSHGPLPERAMAQQAVAEPGLEIAQGGTAPGALGQDPDKLRVEAALSKRLPQVSFVDTTLEDVLNTLADRLDVDILIDKPTLADEGVALDQTVNFSVSRTQLTGRAALELILEPFQLTLMIRDGLIMVTTAVKGGENLEIQVYNVRDLIIFGGQPGLAYSAGIDRPSDMSFASVESLLAPLAAAEIVQFGGGTGALPGAAPESTPPAGAMPGSIPGMPGGMGGGMGGGGGPASIHQTNSLAQLIAITIDADSWSDVGGPGSIVQYGDGLLVAKNTQKVHGKIRELLTMLRESNRIQPPGGGPGAFIPFNQTGGGPPTLPSTGN